MEELPILLLMSSLIDHAKTVHRFLLGAGIEHLLLGDAWMSATGNRRFEDDLDFVVARSNQLLAKNCLLEHGFTVLAENQGVCQLDGPVPVDLIYAQDALFKELFYKSARLDESDLKYIGVEGVIALKIQTYSEDSQSEAKELEDIANLIEERGDISWTVLKEFADLFRQWPRLEAIKGVATKVSE